MSINWVMLDANKHIVPLPKEKILFYSPPRTTLTLTTPNSYPGKEPLNLGSNGGTAYVTNQRVVFLPTNPQPHLESFSAPILNLSDTHVTAPFFGPNAWIAVLKPVTGGNIPAQHAFLQVKMTFKDGGAYDFSRIYEEVKEKTVSARDLARDAGRTVDLSDVPLEQLPAYEETGNGVAAAPRANAEATPIVAPTPTRPAQNSSLAPQAVSVGPSITPSQAPPNEPPPGYEEAQSSSVMNRMEEQTRKSWE